MNQEIPTPMTDALSEDLYAERFDTSYIRMRTHAHDLERQLAACQSGNRSLADALDKAREQLAEEWALADRLAYNIGVLLEGYNEATGIAPISNEAAHTANQAIDVWKQSRNQPPA